MIDFLLSREDIGDTSLHSFKALRIASKALDFPLRRLKTGVVGVAICKRETYYE